MTVKTGMGKAWMALFGSLVLLAACQPKLQIEAPKKPIVINLNIKIEQEVRVKVEKEVEDLLKKDGELF